MQSSDKNEILLAIEKLNQKIDFVKADLQKEMQEQLRVIPEMQEPCRGNPAAPNAPKRQARVPENTIRTTETM